MKNDKRIKSFLLRVRGIVPTDEELSLIPNEFRDAEIPLDYVSRLDYGLRLDNWATKNNFGHFVDLNQYPRKRPCTN